MTRRSAKARAKSQEPRAPRRVVTAERTKKDKSTARPLRNPTQPTPAPHRHNTNTSVSPSRPIYTRQTLLMFFDIKSIPYAPPSLQADARTSEPSGVRHGMASSFPPPPPRKKELGCARRCRWTLVQLPAVLAVLRHAMSRCEIASTMPCFCRSAQAKHPTERLDHRRLFVFLPKLRFEGLVEQSALRLCSGRFRWGPPRDRATENKVEEPYRCARPGQSPYQGTQIGWMLDEVGR